LQLQAFQWGTNKGYVELLCWKAISQECFI